jgi:hypothetical protein
MSRFSQRNNCLADPDFARIISFQDQHGSVAAIISRTWHGGASNNGFLEVVQGFQKANGCIRVGFGHSLVLGDLTTGLSRLDTLARDGEIDGFVISLSSNGRASLVDDVLRLEHAVVKIEGKELSGLMLHDVAVKVTSEGDITFPPFS